MGPTACCTTTTNAMIICSGAGGFSEAPKAADFNGCSAKCATVQVQDVSSGAAGTALSSISGIAGIIMATRLSDPTVTSYRRFVIVPPSLLQSAPRILQYKA